MHYSILEDHTIMFRKIISFFGRIFRSKGFRVSAKVIFWILAGYFILSYYYVVVQLMQIGMTFREAVTFIFEALFWPFSRPLLSIAVGIVIGMLGYYRGRRKNAEPENEEEPAETPEPAPVQEQEEEIIETKHYMFH